MGLFSLEKRLTGELSTTFQYFKGGYKEDGEDGDSLSARSHMENKRGSRYKLLWGRLQLDTENLSQCEQSAIGTISPGSGGFPLAARSAGLRFRVEEVTEVCKL